MATESKESIFSGLIDFGNEIKNFFNDIINKTKIKINEMCGKEIFEVVETTKKDLKKLENDVLKINDNKINDKELSSEETKLLNKLNDKEKFNDYFKFLKDNISDDDLIISEKELIIKMLKELSNNDNDSNNGDLEEQEFKNIETYCENKQKVIKEVLEDTSLKDKKSEILQAYNEIFNNKETPTADKIKEKLKGDNSSGSSESEKSDDTKGQDNGESDSGENTKGEESETKDN